MTENPSTKPANFSKHLHDHPLVLERICKHLSYDDDLDTDPEDIPQGRPFLLRLALSCRPFLEPALDRIWYSLDTLYPLLKLLPAFQLADTTYVLRGEIKQEAWARFDWYARRVKRFSYSPDPVHLNIAMHVYFRIAQLRSTPLLPSLQHLSCPDISQTDFLISGICLFLSPSVESLDFSKITSVEDKLCGTFLHTLWNIGARVHEIGLCGGGLSAGTVDLVLNFEGLKVLSLSGLGATLQLDWVKRLGDMPHLDDMGLDFTNSPMEPPEEDIGFAGLKKLMINAPLSFFRAFISHITTPNLRVVFAFSPSDSQAERAAFVREVVERWGTTLHEFSLTHSTRPGEGIEAEEMTMTTIAPLLPLSHFECLRLQGYIFDLTNDDFKTLGSAWPKLKELLLPFHGPERTRPSLEVLEMLAELCPKLKHIRIPLDIENIPPFRFNSTTQNRVAPADPQAVSVAPAAVSGLGGDNAIVTSESASSLAVVPKVRTPHRLEKLTIATSSEVLDRSSLLCLSRHIDHLFPYIKQVGSFEMIGEERWSLVRDLVRAFQTVRAETMSGI